MKETTEEDNSPPFKEPTNEVSAETNLNLAMPYKEEEEGEAFIGARRAGWLLKAGQSSVPEGQVVE